MSFALTLAVLAHFLYALVFLADRFVIARAIRSPYVYTFFICILGLSALVFAPFGLHLLTSQQTMAAILSGGTFMLGTLFFLSALQHQPTTHVAPLVGGLTPLFTFVFSWIFLEELLPTHTMLAVTLLVIGSLLIALAARNEKKHFFSLEVFLLMVFSAIFYGVSFASVKWLYGDAGFISGFVWTRIAAAGTAVLLLASPRVRKEIQRETRRKRSRLEWLSLSNKFVGAVALLLLNYAISRTSATIVNALQGVQYVFLLLIVHLVGKRYPTIIAEQLFGKNLALLICAVGFILLGLAFLTF